MSDKKKKRPPNRTRAVKKIRVTSNGTKIVKWICEFPGYELSEPGSRLCVRSTLADIRKRFLASRQRVRKIRGKMNMINKRRARAMRHRAVKIKK